jgi:hypothetical protein
MAACSEIVSLPNWAACSELVLDADFYNKPSRHK